MRGRPRCCAQPRTPSASRINIIAVDTPDTAAPASTPAHRSRAGGLLLLALLLVAATAAGLLGWQQWRALQAQAQARDQQQRDALEARIDALRQGQRGQAQRLQQAEATNRVLRDELLGLGQRAAAIEDSVSKLADPDRHGAQTLRLDQVELLLAIGQQRLQLDGDLDGARRALALAAPLLAAVDDPAWLNLKQTLAQERAALEALGSDPRTVADGLLDQLVAAIPLAPPASSAAAAAKAAPWYARVLDRIVHVQPTAGAGLRHSADRQTALAALQLEATLARAAIARRDAAGLQQAVVRIDGWLRRLLAGSPQLAQRQRLSAQLRAVALDPAMPLSGSTLAQLRAQRDG